MQKLITLTIDIKGLQAQNDGSFQVSEIDAVGELLAAGWAIESWEFVTGDQETAKAVVMLLLNDGMEGVGFEDSYYDFDEQEYEEAEEDEDAGNAEETENTPRTS